MTKNFPRYRIWEKISTRLRLIHSELADKIYLKPRALSSECFPILLHARRICYLTVRVNQFAGFGHQVSTVIAGYLWAKDLGVEFQVINIPADTGGIFKFKKSTDPSLHRDCKTINLPYIRDERNPQSLKKLQNHISKKLRFNKTSNLHLVMAIDAPRYDQNPASQFLRDAYQNGLAKRIEGEEKDNHTRYIAVHIRRGDINKGSTSGDLRFSRWKEESWYVNIISELRKISKLKEMEIRVFSQDNAENFPLLKQLGVIFNNKIDRDFEFQQMVNAYILVTSPSSFSATAGLISNSAVLSNYPWWHFIREENRWFRVSNDGNFDRARLEAYLMQNDIT